MSYGGGSNCAAVWEQVSEPHWVRTEFVPEYTAHDIGKYSDGGGGRPGRIDMHRLSYAEGDDDGMYRRQFGETIRPIIDSYGQVDRRRGAEDPRLGPERQISAPMLPKNTSACAGMPMPGWRKDSSSCLTAPTRKSGLRSHWPTG